MYLRYRVVKYGKWSVPATAVKNQEKEKLQLSCFVRMLKMKKSDSER